MALSWNVRIRRSLRERRIRTGIPAVAAMVAAEIAASRWLLAAAHGTLGWMSVAIATWALGMGIAGWLMATRRGAGLVFL